MSQKFAHVDSDGYVIDFYADDVHDQIPTGAIAITEAQYQEMVNSRPNGERAHVTAEGKHSMHPKKPPTPAEAEDRIRNDRKHALHATDWLTARHTDEKLAEEATTLSADQAKKLIQYRKALRDVTKQPGFPFVKLPTKPDFIE